MSDLLCVRCGGDDVVSLERDEDEDGYAEDDDRAYGWCNDCGDYRFLDGVPGGCFLVEGSPHYDEDGFETDTGA